MPLYPVAANVSAVYNVEDYGAACDGTTNDSAAWQACIDDAHETTNGGQITVSGLSRIATGIVMPTTGNFRFTSAGGAGSARVYDLAGTQPAGGILTTGNVAVPAGAGSIGAYAEHATYLFYASGKGEFGPSETWGGLTVAFEDLLLFRDASSGMPQAIYLDQWDQTGSLRFLRCQIQNVGLYFHYGGSTQMDTVTVIDNRMVHGGWIIDQSPPWQAVFAWNTISSMPGVGAANGGSWDNLSTKAQLLECTGYHTWRVHDNQIGGGYGESVSSGGTRRGAVIYYHNVDQTQDGAIHDNTFFGCSDAAIYIQSSWDGHHLPQAGLNIHDNQFTRWNGDNVTSALSAAIYIDAPVDGGITDVLIGANQYVGIGAYSDYGIVIAGDPLTDAGSITINPQQVMSGIKTAPYRIDGTNYGSPIVIPARLRVDPPEDVGVW